MVAHSQIRTVRMSTLPSRRQNRVSSLPSEYLGTVARHAALWTEQQLPRMGNDNLPIQALLRTTYAFGIGAVMHSCYSCYSTNSTTGSTTSKVASMSLPSNSGAARRSTLGGLDKWKRLSIRTILGCLVGRRQAVPVHTFIHSLSVDHAVAVQYSTVQYSTVVGKVFHNPSFTFNFSAGTQSDPAEQGTKVATYLA